jgi:hypothetical protein
VPDIAGSSEQRDVAKIGEHLARRTDEVRKSRMPRTDEAPDDADREEADLISVPHRKSNVVDRERAGSADRRAPLPVPGACAGSRCGSSRPGIYSS